MCHPRQGEHHSPVSGQPRERCGTLHVGEIEGEITSASVLKTIVSPSSSQNTCSSSNSFFIFFFQVRALTTGRKERLVQLKNYMGRKGRKRFFRCYKHIGNPSKHHFSNLFLRKQMEKPQPPFSPHPNAPLLKPKFSRTQIHSLAIQTHR